MADAARLSATVADPPEDRGEHVVQQMHLHRASSLIDQTARSSVPRSL